jgi:hypothetical protein
MADLQLREEISYLKLQLDKTEGRLLLQAAHTHTLRDGIYQIEAVLRDRSSLVQTTLAVAEKLLALSPTDDETGFMTQLRETELALHADLKEARVQINRLQVQLDLLQDRCRQAITAQRNMKDLSGPVHRIGLAIANLGEPVTSTGLLATQSVARAGGLMKAVEIVNYHASLPSRNEAWKAACRDIAVSCEATAGRILRGEYEEPTSDVMGSQD